MKIFKIWQTENNDYDTYDSAVVVAEDENAAKLIHPCGSGEEIDWDRLYSPWCSSPDKVEVEYIGETHIDKQCVICSSFNAG